MPQITYDELTTAEHAVVSLSREYTEAWRDKDDSYWFARLVEEIGELGGALVGNHESPVEWELRQIGSICMNWLAKRKTEK